MKNVYANQWSNEMCNKCDYSIVDYEYQMVKKKQHIKIYQKCKSLKKFWHIVWSHLIHLFGQSMSHNGLAFDHYEMTHCKKGHWFDKQQYRKKKSWKCQNIIFKIDFRSINTGFMQIYEREFRFIKYH